MKAPSSILAFASLVATAHGHGYISQPKASYEPNTIYTSYNALTTASVNAGFNGGKYDGSPADNAKAFTDHWNATGYKSLREMVDPIAPDFGKSLKTVDPVDVTSYTEMSWQNDEYKEGFIASHSGPCEAWIDDVRVFHHDNCAAEFTTYPAKIPTDYSSCKGECFFSFYWLALHEPNWQIYKQGVPITNSGSSDTTPSSGSTAETATDAPVSDDSASAVDQTESSIGGEASGSVEQTSTSTPETVAPSTPTVTSATPVVTEAPISKTGVTAAPETTTATPEVSETPVPTTVTPSVQDNCNF